MLKAAASPDHAPAAPDNFRRRLRYSVLSRGGALALGDILAFTAAFLVAALATLLLSVYQTDNSYADLFPNERRFRILEILSLSGALLVWFFNCGHYTLRMPFWTEIRQVVTGCCLALLADGFLQFATKHDFSRLWLVHTWMLAVPLVLVVRRLMRVGLRAAGLWEVPALVVGSRSRLQDATDLIQHDRALGYRVVASRTLDSIAASWPGSWLEICRAQGSHVVILAVDENDLQTHRMPISRLALERIPFVYVQSLGGLPVTSMDAHYFIGHDVVLLVGQTHLMRPLGRCMKMVFDYLVAALLMLAASPLFALFILLIRRDGGPAIYAHPRIGRNGQIFHCLKFRTMAADADRVLETLLSRDAAARREWAEVRKLRNDPRVTAIGRILRRFSLDEMPQLINVLRGEMSLVGPRPIHPDEADRFGADLAYYLQTLPGITGLWQASGRNDLNYLRRIELNTWYVKNWSLWLDVAILAKTVPTVFSRRGAY